VTSNIYDLGWGLKEDWEAEIEYAGPSYESASIQINLNGQQPQRPELKKKISVTVRSVNPSNRCFNIRAKNQSEARPAVAVDIERERHVRPVFLHCFLYFRSNLWMSNVSVNRCRVL
jgi:hypothetical protein